MSDYSAFKDWDDDDFEFDLELYEALYTKGEYEPIGDRMLSIWNVMFSLFPDEPAEENSAYHTIFKACAYAGWCAGVDAAAKGLGMPKGKVSDAAWRWLNKQDKL